MSPQSEKVLSSTLAALSIQALRQGRALWFRVASGSMSPLLRVGDEVYIEPARTIRLGEIAAFETSEGLVIHRIVHSQQIGTTIRLLQMADVDLHPGWIEEQAVIGRVVATRRGSAALDLRHPLAKRWSIVTAHLCYAAYKLSLFAPVPAHTFSRAAIYMACWAIRHIGYKKEEETYVEAE